MSMSDVPTLDQRDAVRNRPAINEAFRFLKLSRLRDTQERYQQIRDNAQASGIEVSEELAMQGFRGFEDFYLSCPKFSLFTSTRKFAAFGSDYACFFDFIKFTGFLYMLYFAFTLGLMGTTYLPIEDLSNIAAQWGTDDLISVNWYSPMVLGRESNEAAPIITFWVVFLLSVLIFLVYEVLQHRTEAQIDAAVTSPEDYAVLVRGLPTTGEIATHEKEIKAFFEKNSRPGSKTEIVKVVIGWDMQQYKAYKQARKKALDKLHKLLQSGADMESDPRVLQLRSQLGMVRDHLLSADKQYGGAIKSSGLAVVTFRHQSDHRETLHYWDNIFARIYTQLGTKGSMPLFKGNALSVTRAPNPRDILWEDLAAPKSPRWWRQTFFWICLLCVLILNIVAHYLLVELDLHIPGWWISVVLSVPTWICNVLLIFLARLWCSYEYHDTRGHRQTSLTWKMTTATVVNTVFIPLLVNECFYGGYKTWYHSSGLFGSILMMLLVSTFMPAVDTILSTVSYRQVLVRWIDIEKTRMAKDKYYQYYEPNEIDLPPEFSNLVTLATFVAFYMPMLPWAPGIALVGVILYYWIAKYLFVRKFKRPIIYARRMASRAGVRAATAYVLLALPVGHGWFLSQNYGNNLFAEVLLAVLVGLGVVIAGCTFLLPYCYHFPCFQRLNDWRTANSRHPAKSCDYYEAQRSWPKGRTYHTVQPLYRNLPENLNPRILQETDGCNEPEYFQNALAEAIREEEEQNGAMDIAGWFEALAITAPPMENLHVVIPPSESKAVVSAGKKSYAQEPDPDPEPPLKPSRHTHPSKKGPVSQALYGSHPLQHMRQPAYAPVLDPPPVFVASAPLPLAKPELDATPPYILLQKRPSRVKPVGGLTAVEPNERMPLRRTSPDAADPNPNPERTRRGSPASSQPLPSKSKWV